MRTTIWWGYTTPHGNICQAFRAIFCHFFPFSDICRIFSLTLAIAEQIREASYYVMLISSLNSQIENYLI